MNEVGAGPLSIEGELRGRVGVGGLAKMMVLPAIWDGAGMSQPGNCHGALKADGGAPPIQFTLPGSILGRTYLFA